MRIPSIRWVVAGLICLALSNSLAAVEKSRLTLEQRLERLERVMHNQSLADLVYKMQRLQQEVQRLQGELELQKHAMDAMNKRQRDLYLDIDQRLSRLQPGASAIAPPPAAVTTPPGNPPVTAPTSTPVPLPVPEPKPAPVAAATGTSPPQVPPTNVAPVDPKQEAEDYQSAFNLLKQGRYVEAVKAFREFLGKYAAGSYADNAQYWLAEASYVNRDYDTALGDFEKVLAGYPQSNKVPGAMLKMGYIYHERQEWQKAREILQKLLADYPGSTEARLGEKRLQRIGKEGH